MKRIYLLMIAVFALAGSTFAQVSSKNVDLTLTHLISRNGGTFSAMMAGDTIFINDGTSHPHKVEYQILMQVRNNGPDDLDPGDTLHFNGWALNLNGYLNPTGNGLKKDSTTTWNNPNLFENGPAVIQPNPNLAAGQVSTIDYCDTIAWIKTPNPNFPGGDTIKDINIADNHTCTQTVLVAWPAAVNELEVEANKIFLFPNPATNRLDLRYNFVKSATDVSIVVTNAAGQVVLNKNVEGNFTNSSTIPLNISDLSAGMYFIRLSADNGDVVSDKFNVVR